MRSLTYTTAAILAAITATPATAAPIVTVYGGTVTDFSFSVTGNTITINETWTSSAPVFLSISGLEAGDNYTVIKNVTNNTGAIFTAFANELLDPAGNPNDALDPNPQPIFVPGGFSTSNDNDGLSFAQGSGIPRTSSAFGTVVADELSDVRDFLDFVSGSVANGATFNMSFGLRDNSGVNQPFLLAQRANVRSIQNPVPEPGTWALMITGFMAVGGIMRSKRRSNVALKLA